METMWQQMEKCTFQQQSALKKSIDLHQHVLREKLLVKFLIADPLLL